MMRIGVKYCGGCNPMFDRGKMVARLQKDFPSAEIVPADDGNDYAVIVCGCKRACALHEGLTGKHGKTIATEEAQYTALREDIRRALQKIQQ